MAGEAGRRGRAVDGRKVRAWAVHLYTALNAPLAVWAIFATFASDFRTASLLITATLVIDATDVMLARAARVAEVLPGFDGRRLDDIVDYLCWVVAPLILLVEAGLLPVWVIAAPLLASGYGFGQVAAKTEDDYFLGFPSYWSLVGFYLYLVDAPQAVGVPLILLLSLLVFVPIRYPYPTKTRAFRRVTLVLSTIWGGMFIALAALLPDPPRWLIWLSLYYPLYYLALTVALWWQRRGDAARGPGDPVRSPPGWREHLG